MATQRICIVESCGKKVCGHGYCSAHYQRWRRHGDPLAGGIPKRQQLREKFVHEVAVSYQGNDCLIWPYGKGKPGYGMVCIDGKNRSAHRLVCELVHGKPESGSLDVRHKCGVRACVNPRHLEWGTRKQNMEDKVRHGTAPRGSNNGHAKLTEDAVRWIRISGRDLPRQKVADKFGVSRQAISHVLSGTTWEWLKC